MIILITNDDGIDAVGINTLYDVLSEKHDVYMIAPHRERSACSNAITLHSSLKVKKYSERRFSTEGYPVDCVNVGLYGGLIPMPELVISGINHGPNMGDDIYYSGTVAGARSAFVHGLNSIAVSYDSFSNYQYIADAAYFAENLANKLIENHDRFFVNLNYPALSPDEIKGKKFTSLGRRKYVDEYRRHDESHDEMMLTIDGYVESFERDGTDVTELKKGFVSITPLELDTTDYTLLEKLIGAYEQFATI